MGSGMEDGRKGKWGGRRKEGRGNVKKKQEEEEEHKNACAQHSSQILQHITKVECSVYANRRAIQDFFFIAGLGN